MLVIINRDSFWPYLPGRIFIVYDERDEESHTDAFSKEYYRLASLYRPLSIVKLSIQF